MLMMWDVVVLLFGDDDDVVVVDEIILINIIFCLKLEKWRKKRDESLKNKKHLIGVEKKKKIESQRTLSKHF